MIAVNSAAGHSGRWQQAMRDAVTDAGELAALLGLDPALVAPARLAAARFGLKVPRGDLARMRRGDPDDPLLRQVLPQWLGRPRLRTVLVVHTNHAAELDAAVADALAELAARGVMLLNQSVLLRGVYDSIAALESLSLRLAEVGVVPYYLHLLDRVRGAAHFEVPEAGGRALVAALRERLPGYLVPRLVRETAAAGSKTPVA